MIGKDLFNTIVNIVNINENLEKLTSETIALSNKIHGHDLRLDQIEGFLEAWQVRRLSKKKAIIL